MLSTQLKKKLDKIRPCEIPIPLTMGMDWSDEKKSYAWKLLYYQYKKNQWAIIIAGILLLGVGFWLMEKSGFGAILFLTGFMMWIYVALFYTFSSYLEKQC